MPDWRTDVAVNGSGCSQTAFTLSCRNATKCQNSVSLNLCGTPRCFLNVTENLRFLRIHRNVNLPWKDKCWWTLENSTKNIKYIYTYIKNMRSHFFARYHTNWCLTILLKKKKKKGRKKWCIEQFACAIHRSVCGFKSIYCVIPPRVCKVHIGLATRQTDYHKQEENLFLVCNPEPQTSEKQTQRKAMKREMLTPQ